MQLELYGELNNLATSNNIHILFSAYVNNKILAKLLIPIVEFTSPMITIPTEHSGFILESTVSPINDNYAHTFTGHMNENQRITTKTYTIIQRLIRG